MSWTIWYDDPTGRRLTGIHSHGGFDLTSALNERGAWELVLPRTFNYSLLAKDCILEYWRTPIDGAARLEYAGFLRWWEPQLNENGNYMLRIGGWDFNDLLDRAIAAHYAGTSQASKTGYAGDVLRAIVREQLASGATDYASTARGYSRLAVEADRNDGPSISKGFAWQGVLKTLQAIADISRANGTPIYFGVVPMISSDQTITAEFQVRAAQWGDDHRIGTRAAMVFSPENRNLAEPKLRYEYSDEKTVAYAGGQDTGANRVVRSITDARATDSIWNRREVFVDGRDTKDPSVLDDRAREALNEGISVRFSGALMDTETSRYGINWVFGDYVSCQFAGLQFDTVVLAREFKVEPDGSETLIARVEV
jgi:hypothetical protein